MPTSSINRLTGAGTLLLLGLAGVWLSRPQPRLTAPAPAAKTLSTTPPLAADPPHTDSSAAGFSARATASAQAAQTSPAPDSAGSCPTQPLAFVSSPALRRPLQVRRYVGTVGGQPATAVLQWYHPDSVQGRFYLLRGGPEYGLNQGKPLRRGRLAVEQTHPFATADQGYWQLSGRPGAVLRGRWQRAGRLQLIELREDYAGALRYRVETRLLAGGPAADDADCLPPNCHVPLYRRDFLLPLDPVAPALRTALVATEAARRRLMRENREDDAQTSVQPDVRLNDYGLLSFQTIHYADPFGGKPQHGIQSALYDLRTGQPLTIASQLRPGYEQPLRQLITRRLLHDADFLAVNEGHAEEWRWLDTLAQPAALAPLPDQQPDHAYNSEYLALTGVGLEAYYSPFSLYKDASGGMSPETVMVPYAELRPLVRPGSALDHMLKARGIN